MIGINIGRLEIIDNDLDGVKIIVKWDVIDDNAPFDNTPSTAVSGIGTRPFHEKIPEWVELRAACEVTKMFISPIRLELVISIINKLPTKDDELAKWLKYWANKAMNELGKDTYFYYN